MTFKFVDVTSLPMYKLERKREKEKGSSLKTTPILETF